MVEAGCVGLHHQEYHFILKKILDRVAKKTAADVDATAAARATASAALAAVPGPDLACWLLRTRDNALRY